VIAARRCTAALLLFVAIAFAPGAAKETSHLYYITTGSVDLAPLLAPPPKAFSLEQENDDRKMAALLARRTPEQSAQAARDAHRNAFIFSDVLGPAFTATSDPLAAALFAHTDDDTKVLVEQAKTFFERLRPQGVAQTHFSYPSGHAAFAACTAILLSQMVPEKKRDIFARAQTFAQNRIVAGVHFPSDVEAGWIAGTVVAAALMREPRFEADFSAAKAEVRRSLGLP
jgi:acid phosphatase (class A)